MTTLRLLGFVLVSLMITGCRSTRTIETSWDEPSVVARVASIGGGGKARVRQNGAEPKLAGVFAIDGDSLRFEGTDERTIPVYSVREITYMTSPGRGRGLMLGAVLGLASGAILGSLGLSNDVCNPNDTACIPPDALTGGGLVDAMAMAGTVVGGALGALFGNPTIEIYRFAARSTGPVSVSIKVAPFTAPDAR